MRVSDLRRLVATAMDELRRQLDAQMLQPGNGQLATITSVTTSGGVDTYTLTTDGFGARLLRYGQTVQVFDTTLTILRGSGTITLWDVEGRTVALTPSTGATVATDVIVANGISTPTSLPALFGIPYHHSNSSTGTWLGFNRAVTPEIRANGVNANSTQLTLPLPRLAINKIGNRVGIDNNFNPVAWMHPAQKQAYEEIGQAISLIYKQPKDESLNVYFEAMQMAGAPVKTNFNWDKTRVDFVIDDVWGRGEILPIGFYTTDGRKIFEIRGSSGGVATADIFYMVVGMQTFVSNPAACAYIFNLLIPSGY